MVKMFMTFGGRGLAIFGGRGLAISFPCLCKRVLYLALKQSNKIQSVNMRKISLYYS